MLAEPYRRYLHLLGCDPPVVGLEGLRRIVRRHLCRVAFENVSKLVLFGREGAGRAATLPEFLDGLEHHDLGGTCYTSNPFLAELLRALGYEADLLGADMSTPDVHTVIRVRLDGAVYHVDLGYAAPFYEPLRLGELPHEIAHGPYRYVVARHPRGVETTVWRGAERLHGYVAHEPPRPREFFDRVVRDSYERGRTFMSYLRITRFFDGHTVELKNTTLLRYRGASQSETRLRTPAELEAAVADELQLPRCPVAEAVRVLERVTGQGLFETDPRPLGF